MIAPGHARPREQGPLLPLCPHIDRARVDTPPSKMGYRVARRVDLRNALLAAAKTAHGFDVLDAMDEVSCPT